MPTYQFRCPGCGATFEERRGFARADEAARCPECAGERAVKVIGSALFFSPGSAAKAMLAPRVATRPMPATPDAHDSGCPCCSGRRAP
ncbi:MAG: FmdB family zinc ribbon protein [Thermomicrobiales bacterium]